MQTDSNPTKPPSKLLGTSEDEVPLDNPIFKIISGHPNLLSLYLMRNPAGGSPGRFSQESMVAFLLWFVVHGRHHYFNICFIAAPYLKLLNFGTGNNRTILIDHVIEQNKNSSTMSPQMQIDWFYSHAVPEFRLGPFVPERVSLQKSRAEDLLGVSIVGFHRHALGIGEDARTLFEVLRSLDFAVDVVDIGNPGLQPIKEIERYKPYESERPIFPIVIVCAPLFEMARILAEWGTGPFLGRHVIGYWPWELTSIAPAWRHVFDSVNEIWASTNFLKSVYERLTDKPVFHVPLHVETAAPDYTVKARYGIQDREFSFLSLIDFNSTMKRKNAVGTVQAFQDAFTFHDESVGLIIKTTHGDPESQAWKDLLAAVGNDPRIEIIDGALSRTELCGLIASCDVFVSLHRSEGFGRVIAEAMLLGTLVIATNWSGSQDLLTQETGYPVRCTLQKVPLGDYPEAAGHWAEPDLRHARDLMRLARLDQPRRANIVKAAHQHTTQHYSRETVGAIVRNRLHSLTTNRAQTS